MSALIELSAQLMADQLNKLRAEHETLRAEIGQLTLFLSSNINRHSSPKTYASIERIVTAWHAAEAP